MVDIIAVNKSYAHRKILSDISFHAERSEQIAIVGANGSGKTTFLRIMAGVLKADSGSVEYFGHDICCRAERKHITEYVGYLPQEDPLISELSVQDNIDLWTGALGRPDEKLIKLFDLEEILRIPAEKLSGGMRRRVSIACAVSMWPPILIMDEPTTSLDTEYKDSIHRFMDEYKKLDGTIIFTTHDREEMRMSDHCYKLVDGTLTMNENLF